MKRPLKHYIRECGARNKLRECTAVYSVTNSQGFVPSTDYFSKEVYSKDLTNYKIVKRGMIAYNPSRVNVGSLAVQNAEEQVIVSPLYVVISVDETQLLPEYLCYFLHSDIGLKEIAAHTAGSVRDSLKFSALQNIEITIRSVEEQRFIIRILQKVEALINKRRQTLNKLDDLVKSQFIEMFGDLRLNEKGWDLVPLSEIAEYYNGLTYKPEDVCNDGTLVLRSSNIQQGELDFADRIRVKCQVKERLYVRDGDILMCSRNGSAKLVGKVAKIPQLSEPMTFGAFMMIIHSEFPDFLVTYFRTDAFREQIKTGATTTINQITATMLNKVMLPLPDRELIKKFSAFVEQTDKSKFRIKQNLEKLEILYKSLLQEYFG